MPSTLTVVVVSLLLATPPVIFWLWLVIVPARVEEMCPQECKCKKGGYLVSCIGRSLSALPLIRLTVVRILSLYGYNITLFKRDSLVALTDLDRLSVEYCELTTIELGAFNGLTSLRVLELSDNKIIEIMPGTFESLNSLKILVIRENRLERLDSAVFGGLVNLQRIDLMQNNLQYLHPETFSGLVNLKQISLGSNKLQILYPDTFSGLFNLKQISLEYNELQYLHRDTFLMLPKLKRLYLNNNPKIQILPDSNFINSPSLSHLDISHCNVSSVSVETFANVSALEWLDLSYNNLRTVDINILTALPKLSTMYLNCNSLQCDCQLQEVWRWCEDRNITTGLRNPPTCDTPSEVCRICWGVLGKGQCLEGNIQYYYVDYKCKYNSKFIFDYNDFEVTSKDTEPKEDTKQRGFVSLFLKQYQVPLYAFPFIFGTISNVILLIIIICNKDMRTVPNMYIVNLAISDIIYLTVLFTEACGNRISDKWLEGELMCTFLPFCRRLSVGLSAYSVAVLSFRRYRVTVNPFHVLFSSSQKWRVTLATICGEWIVAAVFAIPSALSKYQCEEFAVLIHNTYLQLMVIFELLVSCVLPLCVIAFSYVMTALHLVENSRSISEGTENPQLETRRNTAKIVVGLTVVFMISYVPYHAFWTYINCTREVTIFSEKINDFLIYSDYKLRYSYQISTCFLLINSCLNPVALFCTSSPFRQHLKRYLTCFCKTSPPPTDLELARRN